MDSGLGEVMTLGSRDIMHTHLLREHTIHMYAVVVGRNTRFALEKGVDPLGQTLPGHHCDACIAYDLYLVLGLNKIEHWYNKISVYKSNMVHTAHCNTYLGIT